jgi:glycosyltransferase involved in cell wall biosynthesis
VSSRLIIGCGLLKLIVRARPILARILCFHSIAAVVRQRLSRLRRQGRLFREEEQVCAQSGVFDREWYLQRNPDVAAAGINPLTHYVTKGAAEGRDPHPLFDSDWYLQHNPDVAACGINPLAHYISKGAAEGRDPHPLFDSDWYLQHNPDVAESGVNPLAHYISAGAAEGRDPHPLFDSSWYLGRNPDVGKAGMNPLSHYIGWGAAEGRDPNPHFDSDWYLERNPDVAVTGANPLSHYIYCGSTEGRDPNPLFDSKWYLERNPEVACSEMNPLIHYIHFRPAEAQCHYPRVFWPRDSPRVSAIVPCYNGARWLPEALESIKAQSLPVQEIILVDDASTDNSAEIAQKHGALVIRNPANRGEGYSRNVGLRHASGDLIAWLDADDVWLAQHVRTLTELLQKYPQATAAFAAVQRFGQRNELIRGYIPLGEPSNVFWAAFRDWVHTTIGSMTHKAALLDIGGFDEQERYSVDFDLWLRLSRHHLFTCTHDVTSRWRWHDAQQSKQLEDQLAAVYRFRRSYWQQERASGRSTIAAEMERQMANIWNEDMTEAWEKRDMSRLRFLWGLTELVPGNLAACRSAFAQRIQEPQALEQMLTNNTTPRG